MKWITVSMIVVFLAGCREKHTQQSGESTSLLPRSKVVAFEQEDFRPSGLHSQVFFNVKDNFRPVVVGSKRHCPDCQRDTPMDHPVECMWCVKRQPEDTESESGPRD